MITQITDISEFLVVLENEQAIVDFTAAWCGPCKKIAPIFHELSEQRTDVRFYKVDIDQVPAAAELYGIRAMPTFVMFKSGQIVSTFAGANPEKLAQEIEKTFEL